MSSGIVARLLQHVRRKLVRDVVLADHDFDIDAEIVRDSPESRSRGPTALLAVFGKSRISTFTIIPSRSSGLFTTHRLHAHAVAASRAVGNLHALRNLDPLLDAIVERHHEVAALANAKLPDDGLVGAPQNADDLAIGPAVRLDTLRCAPRRDRRAWPLTRSPWG